MTETGIENVKVSDNKIAGCPEVITRTSKQEPKEVFNYTEMSGAGGWLGDKICIVDPHLPV